LGSKGYPSKETMAQRAANEEEDGYLPDYGDPSSVSMLSSIEPVPYTPRRLSQGEVDALLTSPPVPLHEAQGVPNQQAMVRREDRNAAAYGVERGRSGRDLSAPSHPHSRTPYRHPSNSQGSDSVALVWRQPAQSGGNVDTYRGGASSSQGQATAPINEMLIGVGQQQEDVNGPSMLPAWLEELWPQEESTLL
jgi:hypothetical protein